MGDVSASLERPLRADAERSVRTILEAAERVLARDPGASLEQVAQAAGVARTTVHRRFATRQALVDAMSAAAVEQLAAAIEAGRPETAPPLVALHEITANVLRVKVSWPFALASSMRPDSPVAEAQRRISRRCVELLGKAQAAGAIDAAVDLDWARRVYYALIGETLAGDDASDPDALAARVVDTLLRGIGPRPA
ncbi:regulatory protein, tetR family [Jiangella alkaliphila]|uniref:Regulatory protein, tetR family n=1 Tax=Jiangella alkaliphila TaxID=419479 RepID=A0A1H2L3V1_9ACTN|nr:regulatory protein, tetR family [Jiangella alkaliphila]